MYRTTLKGFVKINGEIRKVEIELQSHGSITVWLGGNYEPSVTEHQTAWCFFKECRHKYYKSLAAYRRGESSSILKFLTPYKHKVNES